MTFEQGTSETVSFPDVIICDGSDLHVDQSFSIQATESKDPLLSGWLWFNNLSVNNEAGTRLYQGDHPFRAARVRVFASDVAWRYGFSFTTSVKTPLGRNVVTPDSYRFPGLLKYGLVLFQRQPDSQLRAWQIAATDKEGAQEIELSSDLDILVGVNDDKGHYSDNSGSIDLYIQPL